MNLPLIALGKDKGSCSEVRMSKQLAELPPLVQCSYAPTNGSVHMSVVAAVWAYTSTGKGDTCYARRMFSLQTADKMRLQAWADVFRGESSSIVPVVHKEMRPPLTSRRALAMELVNDMPTGSIDPPRTCYCRICWELDVDSIDASLTIDFFTAKLLCVHGKSLWFELDWG